MRRLLIAHPSADIYGSDLQVVQTVRGLTESGWRVDVCVPEDGPLVPRLRAAGGRVVCVPFPALRKAFLRPRALAGLAFDTGSSVICARRLLRKARPDALLVNTLTIPWWIAAGRLAGIPVVAHVHEAEQGLNPVMRAALAAPLMWAHRVIANSESTRRVLVASAASLDKKTTVVPNGLEPPPSSLAGLDPRGATDSATISCIGRLSVRKGTDVALEAVAILRARGQDVRILVAGTTFAGYEWFERDLRARAARADLSGAVEFLGYADLWTVLGASDIVVVPSHGESFGNVAVEALLAGRPLVASRVQGLAEIVRDGETGLLVTPGDAAELADAIESLLDDPDRARELAGAGRVDAAGRFSAERYRREMVRAITATAPGTT